MKKGEVRHRELPSKFNAKTFASVTVPETESDGEEILNSL